MTALGPLVTEHNERSDACLVRKVRQLDLQISEQRVIT